MPDARSDQTVTATAKAIWPGHSFTKPTGPKLPRVSVSSLTAFAVCPQLHGFGYELGLGPNIEKDALKIGSLIHVALAYRYAAFLPTRPEWMVYPDARTALWTCGQDRQDLAMEALRIFDAYQVNYPTLTWRPILVEHPFELVLNIDGIDERYTLRIDLLVEDMFTHELMLIDHKSAYKLSRGIGDGYRTDREMLTGLALCRAHGYDVKRVIINAMTKERPEPKFERYHVPISGTAYERLGTETVHWMRTMRRVKQEWPDPLNRPRAYESCLRKYGRCDFYDVCADGPHRLVEYKSKWGKK